MFRLHALGLLGAAAALLASGTAVAADTAIIGATLIDGRGGDPVSDAVVLVRDDRILAAGRRDAVAIPRGARLIDASGKFVMPGLMDANIHLLLDLRVDTLARYEGRYEQLIEEAAQIALKNGITTVFDSWGPRQPLVNVRNEIHAGRTPGSRIFLAGNIIGIDSPMSGDFLSGRAEAVSPAFRARIDEIWVEGMGSELLWRTPEEVRARVRSYVRKEIDFVKYLVSGHRDAKTLMFSPRAQSVIVEEAHRAGMIVQSHTTSVESLYLAIERGVDLLQHCESTGPLQPMPAALIELLARKQIPCATLAYTAERLAWHQSQHPEQGWTQTNIIKDRNARNMVRAGVNLILATDAGVFPQDAYEDDTLTRSGFLGTIDDPLQIGVAHFHWLVAMEQKGLVGMDLLTAATRKVARAYKLDGRVGTLVEGMLADLLVLDRDPLQAAVNYRSISLVMKDGRVVDRESLPARRLLSAP